jgi:hypothetical protein
MKKQAVALVVTLVVGAGCSLGDTFADNGTQPAHPADSELVGVWVGYASSARYSLLEDHTFTASSVPAEHLSAYANEQPTEAGPFHGDGTWAAGTSMNGPQSQFTFRFVHVFDAHGIPVVGSYSVTAAAGNETVSPDRRLILGLTNDYLAKVD